LVLALTLGTASAQPAEATRAAARSLGYSGVEAYQAGDYATAKDKLEQSFELFQIPSLGLWSARALAKVGMLVEAAERYRRVAGLPLALGDAAIQQTAKADAERELAELIPRIPSLTIQIEGNVSPGKIEVTLDGTVVEAAPAKKRLLNPGKHEVEGQFVGRNGRERTSASLTLSEGRHEEAVLRFRGNTSDAVWGVESSGARPSSPRGAGTGIDTAVVGPQQPAHMALGAESASVEDGMHPAWRTAAWISLGAGGVGFVTGLVAYAIGRGKDLDCPNGGCDPSLRAKVDSYTPVRTVNLAGLIAGSVFSAAGVTLFIVTEVSRNQVALQMGPRSAMLVGNF
jgi:hypothetical protein